MMRASFGLVVMFAMSTGCSAIDNFERFTFDDGGSDAGSDGGAVLSAFGDGCKANGCEQYNAARPTMCEQSVGNGNSFPEGMCTRVCTPGVGACTDYVTVGAGALCAPLFNSNYCLLQCNVPNAEPCRKNYNCCNTTGPTSGPGVCVPADACH
jgi:hypothetical protein